MEGKLYILLPTRVCTFSITQKKFPWNHWKSSPCFTNAVCLFSRWFIESTRSRNPANNSLSLSIPLSTSVFEYTPIKAVSRCTLGKLLLLAARFFIYYISARVTQRNTQSLVTDVKQKTWAWSFYREETLY